MAPKRFPDRMRILGVILARGGSKGVPRKNVRPLGGVPLLRHTLAAANASGAIERTVVSTDDAEIAAISRSLGAEIVDRPTELATDDAKSEPALTHALSIREATDGAYDAVMLLPPTAPFRGSDHIRTAVALFATGRFETIIAVEDVRKYRYDVAKDGSATPRYAARANRDSREATFLENGALYLASAAFVREGRIFGAPDRIGAILMDKESSLNIDEPVDFDVAEAVLRRRLEDPT